MYTSKVGTDYQPTGALTSPLVDNCCPLFFAVTVVLRIPFPLPWRPNGDEQTRVCLCVRVCFFSCVLRSGGNIRVQVMAQSSQSFRGRGRGFFFFGLKSKFPDSCSQERLPTQRPENAEAVLWPPSSLFHTFTRRPVPHPSPCIQRSSTK